MRSKFLTALLLAVAPLALVGCEAYVDTDAPPPSRVEIDTPPAQPAPSGVDVDVKPPDVDVTPPAAEPKTNVDVDVNRGPAGGVDVDVKKNP